MLLLLEISLGLFSLRRRLISGMETGMRDRTYHVVPEEYEVNQWAIGVSGGMLLRYFLDYDYIVLHVIHQLAGNSNI